MPKTKSVQKKTDRPSQSETQIIGFRLPHALAQSIKEEAVRRKLPLNKLMQEFWKLYREAKRAG